MANRNCKAGPANIPAPTQNSKVPVSKSGVIVVDTEKLIQQSAAILTNKKKKKKSKKSASNLDQQINGNVRQLDNSGQSMVTLKNPIFHTLQSSLANKVTENFASEIPTIPCSQQASIIKNENGMVTIRSPRLQHSLANGTPINNLLSELKPVIGPDVSTSQYLQTCQASFSDNCKISSRNAQEILSGLPGIEITKVDKRATKNESESKKSCQAADVSIIPTGNNAINGGDKFHFDKDDWHYGKNMCT